MLLYKPGGYASGVPKYDLYWLAYENLRVEYDGKVDPYDLSISKCPMVNNTSGSVVGYKYYNLSKTKGLKNLSLNVEYVPEGVDGMIDVYLDRPDPKTGIRLGPSNYQQMSHRHLRQQISMPR